MGRIQKNVFICYRHADEGWALAVYNMLRQRGFDVFIDYLGIGSGSFEREILENIASRAHFLVLMTPHALDRVGEPGDWMRREVEHAIELQRNVIPILLDGFDFTSQEVAPRLTGKLSALPKFNGLQVPKGYFEAAMDRLERQYLTVPVETILQPASPSAVQAATRQQAAVDAAMAETPERSLRSTPARVSAAKVLDDAAMRPEDGPAEHRPRIQQMEQSLGHSDESKDDVIPSMTAPPQTGLAPGQSPITTDTPQGWQQPLGLGAFEGIWREQGKFPLPLFEFVNADRRAFDVGPRVGDIYRLRLCTPGPSCLTLLMRGTSGRWLLAYPGWRWPGIELKVGTTYEYPADLSPLPDDAAGLDRMEFGDPGIEVAVALCTSLPLLKVGAASPAKDSLPLCTEPMVANLLQYALSLKDAAFSQCSVRVVAA